MPRNPTATRETVEAAILQIRQSGLKVEYNPNGTVLNLRRVRLITGGATERVRAIVLQILEGEQPGRVPRSELEGAVRLVKQKGDSAHRLNRQQDPGADADIRSRLQSELAPLLHEIRDLRRVVSALTDVVRCVVASAEQACLPTPHAPQIFSRRADQDNGKLAVRSDLLLSEQELENEADRARAATVQQQSLHAENRKIVMPPVAIDDLRNRMPPPVRRRGGQDEPLNNEQQQG